TRVLPVPADASSRTFRDGSTAATRAARSGRLSSAVSDFSRIASWTASSSSSNGRKPLYIADVILAADCIERAGLAAVDVVWRRRELAARDRVDGIGKALLRLSDHPGAVGRFREQRHHALRALEREIRGLAEPPSASVVRCELLLGAHAVDR